MNAADAPALAGHRLIAGLEVAEIGGVLWLRGPAWNEALRRALRKVPGLDRFETHASGRLLADGARVPQGRLPELRWQALALWFPVNLPTAHGLASSPSPAPFRLVRSTGEREAGGVLAELSAWHEFAIGTAEIRLRPLRFAAAHNGRVWIDGVPLPPMPGRRFTISEGIAIPCGFTWSPALSVAAIRQWVGIAEGDVAFATEDRTWEIIRAEQFVPATRSAARATMEALSHG